MTTDEPETRRLTRKFIVALIVACCLLVALIVVVVLLVTRANAGDGPDALPSPSDTAASAPTPTITPTESPTPTPTAEAVTPTPAPEAPQTPSNQTQINSFHVSDTTVTCNTNAPNPSEQYIAFSWSSSNVNQVYFGVNTNDASQAAFFDNLPPAGSSQNDFPPGYTDFTYPCPSASTKYTLTVVGPTGKVSQSVTVTNNGDK